MATDRYRAGCLTVALLLLVVPLGLWFAAMFPTDAQRIGHCPDVVRSLVAERIGEPSSVRTIEVHGDSDVVGTATVGGRVYGWSCGTGDLYGNRVSVSVRDSSGARLFREAIDL